MLKRVIIVSDYAHVVGGVAKVAIASAVGLAARGYDVRYLSACGPTDSKLTDAGVGVTCLEQFDILSDPDRLRAVRSGVWNAAAKTMLERALAESDPRETVVHFHQWTKALSPSVFSAPSLRRFPRTATHHDYFVACPTGSFLVHKDMAICERQPMSVSCIACSCDPRNYKHKMWRLVRHAVQDRLAVGPKTLRHQIFVSRFTRDILKPHLASDAKLYFLSNPIDVAKGPRVEAETMDEYVFVARLSREKGGGLFAEAAKRLGVKAVFVGDGEFRGEIEAINPAAEITGWVTGAVVQERLSRARFLIFPSLWYEAQPLSVQEAASRGVATLCGDRNAACEMVADDRTGLHFANGDVDDLTRKMALLRDDALVRRLSQNAYDGFWSSPRGLEAHVDNLLDIYEEVLRDHAHERVGGAVAVGSPDLRRTASAAAGGE